MYSVSNNNYSPNVQQIAGGQPARQGGSASATPIIHAHGANKVVIQTELFSAGFPSHPMVAIPPYGIRLNESAANRLQSRPEFDFIQTPNQRVAAQVQVNTMSGAAALRFEATDSHPAELYMLDTASFQEKFPSLNQTFKEFILQYVQRHTVVQPGSANTNTNT